MPTLGTFNLTDGQTPSNSVTFTVDSVTGNVVHWNDGADQFNMQRELQTNLARRTTKGSTSVASAIFRIPITDALGNVVAFSQARVEYRFPYGHTAQDRLDLFTFVSGLQSTTEFQTFVSDLQGWYA